MLLYSNLTNFILILFLKSHDNHIIKPVPISPEPRKRITAAKLKGDTEAGKSVHTGTITRLWTLYRATGSYSQRPNLSGRKPALSSEQPEQVRGAIGEQPDITLQELKDRFSLPVSLSALSKTIKNRLELCYKKNSIPRGTASGRGQNKTRVMEIRTARNGD
jgi:transposase